jgi:hypothetical protein
MTTYELNNTSALFDDLSILHADKVYVCHTYDIDGSNIDELSMFATRDAARSHYRTILKDTLIWSMCNDGFARIDDAYAYLDSLTDEQLYEIWMRSGDADRKLRCDAYSVTQ